MAIVKLCNRRHNPLLSDSKLQLCTAKFYSSTDNKFIRDIDEGTVSRVFHPPVGIGVPASELGTMTGLSIGGPGQIHFEGRALETGNPVPHCYLFCTSIVDKVTTTLMDSLGYDSCFEITDPNLFCERIAIEIKKQLVNASNVLAIYGEVSYLHDKAVVFRDLNGFCNSHKLFDPWLFLLKRRVSREDEQKIYANECEYRFAFIPVDLNGQSMSHAQEKIFISAATVRDILKMDCGS